jgi:hypothetical protein
MQMTDEEYQKEYDKAAAELEAAASGKPAATTAQPEIKTDPVAEPAKPEPAPTEVKTEEPAKQPEAKPADPVEELRLELEKAKKALKDTQAWGHKNAEQLKQLQRERELAQREAAKPAILAQNPELAEAIRYVAGDPTPQIQAEQKQNEWMTIIDRAHPGIFSADIDPELETAILARRESGGADWSDPLVAIAEITAEKLAHAERQIGKRFAAEAAKLQQKSAMSVPGAGPSAVNTQPVDKALEEVKRIQNMSQAEFEKEVRRVKGY